MQVQRQSLTLKYKVNNLDLEIRSLSYREVCLKSNPSCLGGLLFNTE